MELVFSSRLITQADLLPIELTIPRRRASRGRGYSLERLERRLHCDVTSGAVTHFSAELAPALIIGGGGDRTWVVNVDPGHSTISPHNPELPPNGGGILDGSFGEGGIAKIDGFDLDSGQAVVIQADGKIVVAGWSADRAKASTGGDFQVSGITVLRLNTDGSLDKSFGTKGFAHIPITSEGFNRSIAETMPMIQMDDGSLLVGGHKLHKLTADGQIDTSFGDNGSALAGSEPDFWIPETPRVSSIALTADGKILACDERFHVFRLNANGTLDQSFGVGGVASAADGTGPSFNDQTHIAVQADGKILTYGTTNNIMQVPVRESLLVRLNADGSRDTSFGDGGQVRKHGATDADYFEGWNLAVTPDGEILTCGESHDGMVLVQYNPDGSLDSSFGDGGIVQDNNDASGPFQIAFDADGKIVLAAQGGEVAAVRYNPDGTRDTTFGDGGVAVTDIIPSSLGAGRGVGESGQALAIQADGKIVVVGHVLFYSEAEFDNADFFIVRLDPEGTGPTAPPSTDTPTDTPAQTPDTPTSGGDDGGEAQAPSLNLPVHGLVFSTDSIDSGFDFDDPSGKKDDIGAEPEETVLPG